MITTVEIDRRVPVIAAVKCNLCGAAIEDKSIPGQFEYATLQANWGYGSKHDMEQFQLEICEDCVYNKILPLMKIQPQMHGLV